MRVQHKNTSRCLVNYLRAHRVATTRTSFHEGCHKRGGVCTTSWACQLPERRDKLARRPDATQRRTEKGSKTPTTATMTTRAARRAPLHTHRTTSRLVCVQHAVTTPRTTPSRPLDSTTTGHCAMHTVVYCRNAFSMSPASVAVLGRGCTQQQEHAQCSHNHISGTSLYNVVGRGGDTHSATTQAKESAAGQER